MNISLLSNLISALDALKKAVYEYIYIYIKFQRNNWNGYQPVLAEKKKENRRARETKAHQPSFFLQPEVILI